MSHAVWDIQFEKALFVRREDLTYLLKHLLPFSRANPLSPIRRWEVLPDSQYVQLEEFVPMTTKSYSVVKTVVFCKNAEL